MRLRSHLITLVTATFLPVFVFVGVLAVLLSREHQKVIERGLVDSVHDISQDIDRELMASIRTLEALATSEHLDSGDLGRFYEQARRVLKAHGRWETIILADPSGQQLINLRLPFRSPLPQTGAPEVIQAVVETAQPAVSNLLWGRIRGAYLLGVDVPVIRHGKVAYVLMASISPASLAELLSGEKSSADLDVTVIDRNRIVIARNRNTDQFLGRPVTSPFAAQSAESREATWRGVTPEGISVQAAAYRSDLSGWTVGVAIPLSLLEAPLRRSLIYTAAGGGLLFLLSLALALFFGRRIAGSISALSTSALALGKGETGQITPSPIAEVNQVAKALQEAAAERQRTEEKMREHTEHLKALSRRLVEIQEVERRSIARELHDEIGQALTGLKLTLEVSAGLHPQSAAAHLHQARVLVNDLVGKVRKLSLELRPAMLDDLGLLPTLLWHFEHYTARTGVRVHFKHAGLESRRLGSEIETAIYRIVQEALTNVARHAGVDQVEVGVRADEGTVGIRIKDQGAGFDPGSTPPASNAAGLSGMRERATMLGGKLSLESAPGAGTLVLVEIPRKPPAMDTGRDERNDHSFSG